MSNNSHIPEQPFLPVELSQIDIEMVITVPFRRDNVKQYPIKKLCDAIRIEDADFPLVDFEEKHNRWIVEGGCIVKRGHEHSFLWKRCTMPLDIFKKLVHQAGWLIHIIQWAPPPSPFMLAYKEVHNKKCEIN